MSTVGFSLLDLFAASLIVCLLEPRGPLFTFFNLAGLRWLGQISYGLYVFHDILHVVLQQIAERVLPHQPILQVHLTALLGLLLTTLLASQLSLPRGSVSQVEGPFSRGMSGWLPDELRRK